MKREKNIERIEKGDKSTEKRNYQEATFGVNLLSRMKTGLELEMTTDGIKLKKTPKGEKKTLKDSH